jgi:hypothetical protein
MMADRIPLLHDPAGRVIPELNRMNFQKSPIRFNALYATLEEHTRREFDHSAVFKPSLFPSHYTVAISEYPLCFAFALAVRLMRTVSRKGALRACATDETVHIRLMLTIDQDIAEVREQLESQHAIFIDMAEAAHFKTEIHCAEHACTLSFLLPFYDEQNFELRATTAVDIADAFRLAQIYPIVS